MHSPLCYCGNFTVCTILNLRIHKFALNSKQENNAETPPIFFFMHSSLCYCEILQLLRYSILELRIHKFALNSKQKNNAEIPPINFFKHSLPPMLSRKFEILLLVLDLRINKFALNPKQENNAETPPINSFCTARALPPMFYCGNFTVTAVVSWFPDYSVCYCYFS